MIRCFYFFLSCFCAYLLHLSSVQMKKKDLRSVEIPHDVKIVVRRRDDVAALRQQNAVGKCVEAGMGAYTRYKVLKQRQGGNINVRQAKK